MSLNTYLWDLPNIRSFQFPNFNNYIKPNHLTMRCMTAPSDFQRAPYAEGNKEKSHREAKAYLESVSHFYSCENGILSLIVRAKPRNSHFLLFLKLVLKASIQSRSHYDIFRHVFLQILSHPLPSPSGALPPLIAQFLPSYHW